jgi:16S rRNA (adenine(1408)-N(1))-methyltransferase
VSGFHRVLGRKTEPLDAGDLIARATAASSVWIDVGTGQGKFVLDCARARPDALVIGIDAAADSMAKAARSAAANPKKGGLPNALFVRGGAEALPGPFAGLADSLSVQYPWGSLMRIVAQPEPAGLAGLRAVCKPGAALSVLLNQSVFEDRDYLARLGMADIADPATDPHLPARYRAAGFAPLSRERIEGDPPVRTAWGRHLVRGSARATLILEAEAIDPAAG